MRIRFFGASGEVTGSCYLLEAGEARVLIDFGLHQGGQGAERRNRRLPPIDARSLDAVVLTHAHIDHCGRLPLLPAAGFAGRIIATPATRDLASIMLLDAARIQEQEAETVNRRRARRGAPPIRPLYTESDAERVLEHFHPLPLGQERQIASGVTLCFHEAGHILGSASARLRVEEGGRRRTIVFSGDIGPSHFALLRDPDPPREADVVVMESTYGDRDHRSMSATLDEMATILDRACADAGRVLVPAFALGRTQQLIYHLRELRAAGRAGRCPVFVDSPMAMETTELYRRHAALFDGEASAIVSAGASPLMFPGLEFIRTGQASRALNDRAGPLMVIAASGMCTGGRILHHLRHSLWREETHVMIVGFQSQGTLGRELVSGARRVRIFGEPIAVKARIHTLGGLSAHAGQSGLVAWLGAMAPSRPRVFLTHGEARPREALRARINESFGIAPELPAFGDSVQL